MGQFELTIRLGNAEMQTPEDVADLLEKIVADLLEMGGDWRADGRADNHTRTVRDVNGNRVGGWRVADDS